MTSVHAQTRSSNSFHFGKSSYHRARAQRPQPSCHNDIRSRDQTLPCNAPAIQLVVFFFKIAP